MASNNSTASTVLDPLGRNKVQIGFEIFFAVVLCLVSLLGNFLVVFVINKDPQLKNITNMFIHNLAWTDICVAVLVFPFWIISLYNGRWIFSAELCEWTPAMTFACIFASAWTMGLIAVNRYLKVVKPNIYSKFFPSIRMARVYCVFVWLLAVLFSTPPLYGWGQYGYNKGSTSCTLVWEIENISYAIVFVGINFWVFFGVILFCYYKIHRTVKANSANLRSHAAQNNASLNNTSHTTDIKVLKTTFTVVCVFVVCWTPASVVYSYEMIFGPPPRLLVAVVTYLISYSSAVNPIIYGLMNPQLKKAFAKVFRCKRREQGSQTNHIVSVQDSERIPAAQEATGAVQPMA